MADALEDEYEVSDTIKLQIAKGFILKSPPGQVQQVIKDVKKLVPTHVLTDEKLAEILQEYDLLTFFPACSETDSKFILSEDTHTNACQYVDTKANVVRTVDHLNRKVCDGEESAQESRFENERKAVEDALESYWKGKYNGQAVGAVIIKDSTLIINTCAERINLRNFWSGRWQSRWELSLDGQGPPCFKGKVKMYIHYFENGNLQLHNDKDISENIEYSDPASLAKAIVKATQAAEDLIHSNLEDMYTNMSQETFKEMRRVMPITQSKMDWSIHTHRTASKLGL